ncbi:hypothetical protein PRIPAC_98082 [Pristionchus pacificus]|uniref:Lipase n=1 Tax=Pristionchus pacificus TaxID=54126 RepID=A0A2A6BJI1_PRIPA|nr:hypothetical protein PRIPAC_98082 [Pristionchus pacificus]|eukprot:PDM66003.1 lipase [Pristionchus pacificus]
MFHLVDSMISYRILILALFVGFIAADEQFGPFTPDFVTFLNEHPVRNEYAISSYKEYGPTGTFGGKTDNQTMNAIHHPVLFVHGNSDSALYFSKDSTGWTNSVRYFREQHYTGYELYGLTYGSRNLNNSLHNSITCRNLVGIRRFIESILSYTHAEKMDIIAHSMGISLARKAVQGGTVHMTEDQCDLGPSLAHRVDSLVAIAGANYGMCLCLNEVAVNMPACGPEGFGPGTCGRTEDGTEENCRVKENSCERDDYSSVLQQINKGPKEAAFVASLWSNSDHVLGINNVAWGRTTSLVKDLTFADQFTLVTTHSRHGGRPRRIY